MAPAAFLRSKWARVVVALFFFLSGTLATLLLMLGTPSFWYFPCAVLWTLSGFAWLDNSNWAPALSSFPVLGITVLMTQSLRNFRETDSSYRMLLLCVPIAIALVAMSFRRKEARAVFPIAVSFSLVLAAFAVDRLFTNKVAIHAYSMGWSADGVAPWGHVELNAQGEAPVIIFRKIGQGYCYDAIFSSELKARLTASNKPLVNVEYNSFSDFGQTRSYNIRSVDGLIFNEGDRLVRAEKGYGGAIMDGPASPDCQR